MPVIKFGNTWLSKKWLNFFEPFFDNYTLEKGKKILRTSRISNICSENNAISSKIFETVNNVNDVNLRFPTFSEREKNKILNIIKGDTLFLSKLFIGYFSKDFFKTMENENISLFPERLKNMKMFCTCGAKNCRHLASIMYLLSSELEKNPFLIFELRGLDIKSELRRSNYYLKSLSDIKTIKEIIDSHYNIDESSMFPEIIEEIDFSSISDMKKAQLSLYSESPLFYPGKDFKKIMVNAYDSVSSCSMAYSGISNKKYYHPESYRNISIEFDENMRIKTGKISSKKDNIYFDSYIRGIITLIPFLNSLNLDNITNCSPSIVALYFIYIFSYQLSLKGAYNPRLLKTEDNLYIIHWFPTISESMIKDILDKIVQISSYKGVFSVKPKRYKLSRESKVFFLCSYFLTEFMKIGFYDYENNDICDLFFLGKSIRTEKSLSNSIPKLIDLWLSRHYISLNEFTPIIKIDDDGKNFILDIMIKDSKKEDKLITFREIFEKDTYIEYRAGILKDIVLISDFFKPVERIIKSEGRKKIIMDQEEFSEFFQDIIPTLNILNIRIIMPERLKKMRKPRLTLSVKSSGQYFSRSYLSIENILEFDWRFAIGDKMFSVNEFKDIINNYNGIVRAGEDYIFVDKEEIKILLNKASEKPVLRPERALQIILSEYYFGEKVKISKSVKEIVKIIEDIEDNPVPKGFVGELREYQFRGYNWLLKNIKLGFGSILADDMGLGKTVQVISVLLKLKEDKRLENKALIVVPKSIIINWQREIKRFAPSLNVFIFHGADRKLEIEEYDIVITTYGIIRIEEEIRKRKWSVLILDEAQNIKNPDTAQTKCVKNIEAEIRIAMSGTPVENRLREYWSIFDFTNKGYLGTQSSFFRNFAYPIEQTRDKKALERFLKITSPFILRRLKTDQNIIRDLPEKIEINEYCNLTIEQAGLYKKVLDNTMKDLKEYSGINRKGLILKLITSLKQICNHPYNYSMGSSLSPEYSGKSLMLMTLLEDIYESGEKVVIFTQYKKMGELLKSMIENSMNIDVLFYHGGLTGKKRNEIIDEYQESELKRIMILSLKAGGTGLNITAASHVIHYDLWWNPAVENQATDRVYRIGQKKKVMVHRLITEGTFEEKIAIMLEEKKRLAEISVFSGEKWIGDFSDRDLREILKIDDKKIKGTFLHSDKEVLQRF